MEDSHLNRERMSFQVQMPEMAADMRTVSQSAAARQRRSRREQLEQERREELEREVKVFSRKGMRASVAFLLLAALAVLLLICWSVDGGGLRSVQRRIDRLDYRMTELDRAYEENQRLLDEKVASLDVGYVAVSQGLISGKGTKAIEIETPAEELFTPFSISEADGQRTSSNSRH